MGGIIHSFLYKLCLVENGPYWKLEKSCGVLVVKNYGHPLYKTWDSFGLEFLSNAVQKAVVLNRLPRFLWFVLNIVV